jgi:8-oxo-dGTP pyrophosphatase MutT (NUDIX family)
MPDPGFELVTIVDEHNQVTGAVTRREMRLRGLPHRSTYILVLDSRGRVYVQKRTMTKDVYPGFYDPVAGGVVLAGESYEDGAIRELEEEMGIAGAPLKPLFDFWFEDKTIRVWGRAFLCRWGGPLCLQAEEVEGVTMMAPEEILSSAEPFTPDGLLVVRRYYSTSASGSSPGSSASDPLNRLRVSSS